ncbi:hypothetical protein PV326_013065 [Microctonus aethiopoides]|nr:hypothetical protein PV326_013065 [Microctonus aethiopoides]
MFGVAWKITKRQQWIKAIKLGKNPKDWAPNHNTRICSSHFINNEKSEHPLHPSYVPFIFPGSENIKKNIESLGRFQRVKNLIMEQGDNVHVNSVEQNQTDAGVESVILEPVQRSISCQTETVVDETYEDSAYFFCNLDYHDGEEEAAAV